MCKSIVTVLLQLVMCFRLQGVCKKPVLFVYVDNIHKHHIWIYG